jgi:hypothetical protein
MIMGRLLQRSLAHFVLRRTAAFHILRRRIKRFVHLLGLSASGFAA